MTSLGFLCLNLTAHWRCDATPVHPAPGQRSLLVCVDSGALLLCLFSLFPSFIPSFSSHPTARGCPPLHLPVTSAL